MDRGAPLPPSPGLSLQPLLEPPPDPGCGTLTVARVAGASALVRARGTAPLHLLTPRCRGASVWVYAATFGGGLVGGDRIELDVDVGPGAAALVATQSSTKVYRTAGPPASQHLRARIAEGALLALLPDPISCFAGAAYRQRISLEIAPGGSLVALDGLVSGRAARRERWAFASYGSVLEIRECEGERGGDADRRLLRDALWLEDTPGSTVAERFGRFEAIASAVVIGPAVASIAASVLASASAPLRPQGPRRGPRASLLATAAPLPGGGALLRVAGESVEQVAAAVRGALGGLAALLGDDPWARRP